MTRVKVNIKHKIVMYALGLYNELSSKNISKELALVLPKYVFIDFLKNINVIQKGERALYRNLEYLEKKKYIKYDNHNITITKKGMKFYKEIKTEVKPFLEIMRLVVPDKIIKKTQKLQTRFK